MKKFWIPVGMLALAACEQQEERAAATQRIALPEVSQAVALPSPDTSNARWTVAEDGRAIQFRNEGEPPLLTLGCRLRENPPELRIVRHVTARPSEKALFPVLGNGTISRFKLDAELSEGEWVWEGSVPTNDPQLDVFTGRRNIEATLPGGGTLKIAGSPLPGEFIDWCRAGGRTAQVRAR